MPTHTSRIAVTLALVTLAITLSGCVHTPTTNTKQHPPVQFIQTASTTTAPSGSSEDFTTTFSNTVQAGNTIVMIFWWQHALSDINGGIGAVTDSEGNVYQLALDATAVVNSSTQADILYYYASNVKGGTSASVTIGTTAQAYTTQVSMVVIEYSGVSVVDATNAASVMTASGINTGLATTSAAPEVVLGSLLTTYNVTLGPGSGYTARFQSSYFVVEDKIATTAGSYDAEFYMPPPYPQYLIAVPSMITLR